MLLQHMVQNYHHKFNNSENLEIIIYFKQNLEHHL